MKLKHLDLFSGIGGFSLGLEATGGFETMAFCDIEEYPRQVLQKHWPHVKQYKDIKELNYERLKADGINSIDIITGGYPCQPFSVAGRKKGEEDPRHLWPEYFRLVKELRPTWVIRAVPPDDKKDQQCFAWTVPYGTTAERAPWRAAVVQSMSVDLQKSEELEPKGRRMMMMMVFFEKGSCRSRGAVLRRFSP